VTKDELIKAGWKDGECPAYPGSGAPRCLPSICDCFIDTYPDSPTNLHPEAFIVKGDVRFGPLWEQMRVKRFGSKRDTQ
jgi:hypothetical protein